MDKLIELCFRSIIRQVNGDKDISKQYKKLAMEEYKEHEDIIKTMYENKEHKGKKYRDKYAYKVEEIIPGKIKRRLYEMVS